MADETFNPAQESSDYCAMKDDWQQIKDIRAGARVVKAAERTYLPSYEKESDAAYKRRLRYTPWRPVFVDALRNICSKPFTKKVQVNGEAPDDIQGGVIDDKTKRRQGGFIDDVDGQGNHLHVFARDTFVNGVADGLSAILVDYPTMAPGLTLADEKAAGARPYWVRVPAIDIIALYFKVLNGRVVISHIRIKECVVERDGFDEVTKERVRIFELDETGQPMWQLWESQMDAETKKAGWFLIGEGAITLPEIPIALFFTGERSGNYRVKPPLIDMAVMQIEIYRALSRKDEIFTYAGSPMLKATGMNPPVPTTVTNPDGSVADRPAPQIEVGPKVVLFGPPSMDGVQPDWDFIQPDAANLTAVSEDVCETIKEFNTLALQPMMPDTGNITATAAAIDAAKSHSAVEAWANGLTDTLNQAMKFTMLWMGKADTVTVEVHTDFGVDVTGVEEAKVLADAQKRGVISQKTEREELVRRGILGPNFEEEEEEERLADEEEGLEEEMMTDPRTGLPIEPPQPGMPGQQPAPPPVVN